jgi:hypothetical protein
MKKSLSMVASYPPTWIAVVVMTVGVVLLLGFFEPPLPIALLMAALGVALLLAWPLTMARTGTLDRLEFARFDTSGQDVRERESLAAQLTDLGCDQGTDQVRLLGTKLEGLTEVLRQRLDAGEMTYSRYLGSARSVYEDAVDSLREVVISLRSISNIDKDYIGRRLDELGAGSGPEGGTSAGDEVSTLRDRQALHDRQVARVAQLLTRNEAAMTALDSTATALAEAPMGREHASADADAAVAELVALAGRASRYASP